MTPAILNQLKSKTMEHSREPIRYTCPSINKAIRSIECAMGKERDLERMDEDELRDTALRMRSELADCIDTLEELRKSNDELRRWGITEAQEVDQLQNQPA